MPAADTARKPVPAGQASMPQNRTGQPASAFQPMKPAAAPRPMGLSSLRTAAERDDDPAVRNVPRGIDPDDRYTGLPIVRLNEFEYWYSVQVGAKRQVDNVLLDARADRYGCSPEIGFQAHIDGAFGEAVMAKFLDVWWAGQMSDLSADDAGGAQVRCSQGRRNTVSLLLHEHDKDEKVYVLVIGPFYKRGEYAYARLAGWIRGVDGKKQECWGDKANNGRPCFFVPIRALNPMSEFPFDDPEVYRDGCPGKKRAMLAQAASRLADSLKEAADLPEDAEEILASIGRIRERQAPQGRARAG
jgi:hypothetical protein